MVEMFEILDGRLGQSSVERVRYIINNLLHLVIVKYGDISLVLSISTRLRLVTILSLLVKYLIIFQADPCNKSYWASEASPTLWCSIEISRDIYVTGSEKRDIYAQTLIFQYKRCCSKKRNIIYYSKKIFLGLTVSTTLCLHSHQLLATERPSNWSSAQTWSRLLTFQTKQSGWQLNCVTGVRLQNYGKPSLYRK